ncbi:MAG: hypothetical protein NUV78_02430 [Candidatus Zambryskibacteria bacterium]|nr:hypothetical protein [Candidatus Zambryskibacteria bacterium]
MNAITEVWEGTPDLLWRKADEASLMIEVALDHNPRLRNLTDDLEEKLLHRIIRVRTVTHGRLHTRRYWRRVEELRMKRRVQARADAQLIADEDEL